MKTTVILHMFNEEYLLPFWLTHHKDLFDHGIIIDYKSTDTSVDICRALCPQWDILTTRNENFDARAVDAEVMDLESRTDGIKLVLNVTEFLFVRAPLKDLVTDVALRISVNCPYSPHECTPPDLHACIKGLLHKDVRFHQHRLHRYAHSFVTGKYNLGRHETQHPFVDTNDAHIVWFGFYPLNESLLQRKLQIKQHMSAWNIEVGAGHQHLWDKETMLSTNTYMASSGVELSILNPHLYTYLLNTY